RWTSARWVSRERSSATYWRLRDWTSRANRSSFSSCSISRTVVLSPGERPRLKKRTVWVAPLVTSIRGTSPRMGFGRDDRWTWAEDTSRPTARTAATRERGLLRLGMGLPFTKYGPCREVSAATGCARCLPTIRGPLYQGTACDTRTQSVILPIG